MCGSVRCGVYVSYLMFNGWCVLGDGRIGVESEVLKKNKQKKKTSGRIVIKKKMWRSWRHIVCGFGYVVEKSTTCDIEGGKEK